MTGSTSRTAFVEEWINDPKDFRFYTRLFPALTGSRSIVFMVYWSTVSLQTTVPVVCSISEEQLEDMTRCFLSWPNEILPCLPLISEEEHVLREETCKAHTSRRAVLISRVLHEDTVCQIPKPAHFPIQW